MRLYYCASNDRQSNIQSILTSLVLIIPKKLAADVDADLIMCGTSGLNAVERFIVGSVSEAIVRHSPCDVLANTSQGEWRTIASDTDPTIKRSTALSPDVPHIIKSASTSAANFLGIINTKLVNIDCILLCRSLDAQ